MVYIDNWRLVAAKLCMSPTGIWFDCVTSIPWSFIDLHSYLVSIISPVAAAMDVWTENVFQGCVSAGSTFTIANDNRVVRIIKVMRMMRIVRILRLVKFVT